MITGKNIYKRYDTVQVLKGVDIEIKKGEVASIVGPSGSGKSTLLHILGTLDQADKGAVVMNDTNIHLLSKKKLAAFRNKHIGFVFQFHHLQIRAVVVLHAHGLSVSGGAAIEAGYHSGRAPQRGSLNIGSCISHPLVR